MFLKMDYYLRGAQEVLEKWKINKPISHQNHIHITEILKFYQNNAIIGFRELEK